MFGKKEEKRFAVLHEESTGFMTSCSVIVDKQTGVNYLLITQGQGSGLTPLLDRDGRPVVSTRDEIDELQYK